MAVRESVRGARRTVALAALLCAATIGAGATTGSGGSPTATVDAGEDGSFRYVIRTDTISVEGSFVKFQTRATYKHNETGAAIANVGVDCIARKRIEYSNVSTHDGRRWITNTARPDEIRSIYEGTRQARELDTVCRLAGVGPGNEQGRGQAMAPQEIPPTPIPPPRPDGSNAVSGTGSGFFVSASGLAVTSQHVVGRCRSVDVVAGDVTRRAKVIAEDRDTDLALIAAEAGAYVPLPLAESNAELGEAISVLGFPLSEILNGDLRVTTGIVSSLSGIQGDRRMVQISAAIAPGSSGGPVLNPHGGVVGVVAGRLADRFQAQNVNFAVNLSELRAFLKRQAVNASVQRAGANELSVAAVVRRTSPALLRVVCRGRVEP